MTRTPTTCYEIPILEVLYDLGGCGYRCCRGAPRGRNLAVEAFSRYWPCRSRVKSHYLVWAA